MSTFHEQRKAKQQEFLDKIAEVCKKQGGMCTASGSIVIVDTNLYNVTLKEK